MEEKEHEYTSKLSPFIKVFTAFMAFLLTFALLLLLIYQPAGVPLVFFDPTITPTYLTNTPTITSTPPATATPTSTPTLQATLTPFPASAYTVTDFSTIRPALGIRGESAVILNEDIALVEPPLDNIQWISSATIAQDLGYEITEPYFATFGAGAITWSTDIAMKPALYELFVMDTLFSSAGELDFTVRVNDQIIEPIVGKSYIEFQSSRGEPPQYNDLWQSIGIYDISSPGIITISTEWGKRDERSIVAIDRVLLLELSEQTRNIIAALPQTGGTIFIADDTQAAFGSTQYWDYWEDPFAWGQQYQIITDPPVAGSVTWSIPATLSYGNYEIYVWIPKINGTASITYRLYANGVQMSLADGTKDVLFSDGQGYNQEPGWLSIGSWTIPDNFGDTVKFTINLSFEADAAGDIVIDALALIAK